MRHPFPLLIVIFMVLLLVFTQTPFYYPHASVNLKWVFALPTGREGLILVLINLAMLMPLGALLRCSRTPAMRFGSVTFWLLLVSLLAEGMQTLQYTRFPQLEDVVLNTLGGVVGAMIGDRIRDPLAQTLQHRRVWLVLLGLPVYMLSVVGLLAVQGKGASLESWDTRMPLVFRNEATGDRPWRGTLQRVLVFDNVLYLDVLNESGPDVDVSTWAHAPQIDWRDGEAERMDGRLLGSSLQKSEAFTVVAWIRPESLVQGGPARIVSLSEDPGSRNFTLGQQARDIEFRLRTVSSNTNGHIFRTDTQPLTGALQQVVVTYEQGVTEAYVGGKRVLRTVIATPTLSAMAQAGIIGLIGAACVIFAPVLLTLILFDRRRYHTEGG
jgi:VanZ like family/Concanavalin A-like lectin/glucanases superfamily